MRVHYPTHEWWISNTAIGYYKNQWSKIKWIGWNYDTASEEELYICALRWSTDTICGKSITVIFSSSSIYKAYKIEK